ncbi:hypothetical protein FACS189456_5330 [Bacteroidia bacterium]|nr:hypothetical protein FACS189456_5330 [Bacteroidia bacterium]
MSQTSALQTFAKTMRTLKTFSIRFMYVVQDSTAHIDIDQAGELLISDKKYRLDLTNRLILFDGKARYTYLKTENEIVIETPNILQEGIFADPSAIFSIDYNDFDVKQKPESVVGNRSVINLDLTPKTSGLPYQKISLGLNKTTYTPARIIYYGTDKRVAALTISEFNTNVTIADTDFFFDLKNCCPHVEIVDMR